MTEYSTIPSALLAVLPLEAIRMQEPMCQHTTFQIGGPADLYVSPQTIQQLSDAIAVLRQKNIPFTVLGNGSNVLVSDEGIRGAVVCTSALSAVTVSRNTIQVQCGALLSRVARTAQENSLSGMEFAGGIPGTIGGAVFMNAGAYDGQMEQIVTKTSYLDENGTIRTVHGEEHQFAYRTSVFASHPELCVLETSLQLLEGDSEQIGAKMEDFNRRRREKQPLQYPSAGSTFKRPQGYYAGQLIEQAGLRGFAVGGAEVSEKHAGFVINRGGASCADVEALIEIVQQRVLHQFGVELECEVRILR